jgi:excinuclease ABC subunit B
MGITPRSVKKEVKELIDGVVSAQDDKSKVRGWSRRPRSRR